MPLIGLLRAFAILEGVSYLVLLLIAMPLKYWGGMPLAVTVTGGMHGILFIGFVTLVAAVMILKKWSFAWAMWATFLSFIPFGTFWLDKQLKQNKNEVPFL
ncbi:integral membrane protein [Peribacillus deserti]|uniref:Integral membrane protein n=1 Tax=Peribacillus deserti TaxID=673318 RepID=A0ABS2QM10_9BACI|nr:DUF3817 domain-containing protein [Peribacillus deserti]MBM7694206.1 integral membrane protein [Peribacillus deserti]